MTDRTIRILIADSQYLIRFALRKLIQPIPQFELAGEAANEERLLDFLRADQIDIVILDYNQNAGFELQTLGRIRQIDPKVGIIIISEDNDHQNILAALKYEVNSFLTKNCDEEEILDAIKATQKQEKFFCTKIIDILLEKSMAKKEAPSPAPGIKILTPREIEIVHYIAQGMITKEIAGALNLSTHTVYTHRKKILKKLGLNSSSELILYAFQNGLVTKN